MMLLLPGNARALMEHIDASSGLYGWLLTPRRSMSTTGLFGLPFAVDNECFSGRFRPDRFIRALKRIRSVHGVERCLFVVAPDVVGNARETLLRFQEWQHVITELGFRVALAAQDGLEDLSVPWPYLDALFIGGSTRWKLSCTAADLIVEAKQRQKWVHMGRVNSVARASRLRVSPDSIDGTAWAKHPAVYARTWSNWVQAGQPFIPPLPGL